jgi:hypothetical protein
VNDNAVALLDKLAAKLGITAQYLWGVLLKQAPVYATTNLIEYAVTIFAFFLLIRYRKAVNKVLREALEGDLDILGVLLCIVFVISAVGWIISCLVSFDSTITAIVNPEYWALDRLLTAIKGGK